MNVPGQVGAGQRPSDAVVADVGQLAQAVEQAERQQDAGIDADADTGVASFDPLQCRARREDTLSHDRHWQPPPPPGIVNVRSELAMQIVASLIHALPASERRCFDRKEAASYLGVSPAHLDKLVRNGLAPPPIEFQGRKVWDKAALNRLLDSRSGIAGSSGDSDDLDRELAEFEAKHGHA